MVVSMQISFVLRLRCMVANGLGRDADVFPE